MKLVGRRRIHQRRGAQPRNRVVVKTRYPRADAVEGKIHRTMSHGEPGGSDCSCVSTISRLNVHCGVGSCRLADRYTRLGCCSHLRSDRCTI